MKQRTLAFLILSLTSVAATSCLNVRTHSSFEPIHMTLDVNLRVQLQEELSNVFDEIDAASQSVVEPE